MRQASLDRPHSGRRLGTRRAAVAAWTLVLAHFAVLFMVSGSADRPAASPERAIASLVARAVPPEHDACQCTEFDRLEETTAPSLC